MRAHAIAAALTFAFCLLIAAMAGPIDKGELVDTDKLYRAAHERAVREGE